MLNNYLTHNQIVLNSIFSIAPLLCSFRCYNFAYFCKGFVEWFMTSIFCISFYVYCMYNHHSSAILSLFLSLTGESKRCFFIKASKSKKEQKLL